MSDSTRVEGLIRLATFCCAACAIAVSVLRMEPLIARASTDADDAQRLLRSDEVAFEQMGQLSRERDSLIARYASSLTHNTDAAILRQLGDVARRHDLTVVATSFSLEPRASARDASSPVDVSRDFPTTKVTITLAGSYGNLLVATGELSTATDLVRVETPSLRREGAAVIEDVTVHVVQPQRILGPHLQPANEAHGL